MTRAPASALWIFLALPAMTVSAELMPIGPFSGQLTETWESFAATPKGEWLPVPTAIMNGAATISHPQMAVFTSLAPPGLGESGPAQPSDGFKAMVAEELAATVSIVFAEPVVRFGSYWAAQTANQDPNIGNPAQIAIRFYDPADALIGTESFSYSRSQFGDGLLEWHGWSSTIPIKRISYTEDTPVVDGLQADPVPEPTTLVPFALACLWTTSRVRRRRQ